MYVFGTFSSTKRSIKIDSIGYYIFASSVRDIHTHEFQFVFIHTHKKCQWRPINLQNWLYERSTGMESKKQRKIHDSLGSKNWARYGF